jgi:hypothetical protein
MIVRQDGVDYHVVPTPENDRTGQKGATIRSGTPYLLIGREFTKQEIRSFRKHGVTYIK